MPIFTEELTVERTGNWNVATPTIGGESLVVVHSENGISPGVTFSNIGGGHFSQQFTFGQNSNLPGGVAATISSDWHGLTFTGQQGFVFSLGSISTAPSIVTGAIIFDANATVNKNLSVDGEIIAGQDVSVSGKVTANQLVSPTIDNLQAAIDKLQTSTQSSQVGLQEAQANIQILFNDIAAITSRL